MSYALMGAAVVVVLDVVLDASPKNDHVVFGIQIDVFRLDGSPEAFNPNVVLAAPTPVHADLDAVLAACGDPLPARVLAALVGIYYVGLPVRLYGSAQHFYAVLCVICLDLDVTLT